MTDHGLAFQAGVASTIYDVTATMTATHDALIRMWGDRRRGGIGWNVYGPKTLTIVGIERSGPIDEGWSQLETGLMLGEGAPPDDYVPRMRAFAERYPLPSLVIARAPVEAP